MRMPIVVTQPRRLSPGGSADMLAAAWFVHSQQNA
jgi:triphosphoribosyl-dephospho-CoA synthetase